MGILGLGFVSAYLSQPLLDGFAMGASVTILTSQLRHLLGVRVPRHQGPGLVVSTWLSLLRSAGQANLCDVLTSAVCLAVLLAAKAQSCPTLCDPMNRSTPGLPVHHQLPESTQTHPRLPALHTELLLLFSCTYNLPERLPGSKGFSEDERHAGTRTDTQTLAGTHAT